jgi:hypothetical protein
MSCSPCCSARRCCCCCCGCFFSRYETTLAACAPEGVCSSVPGSAALLTLQVHSQVEYNQRCQYIAAAAHQHAHQLHIQSNTYSHIEPIRVCRDGLAKSQLPTMHVAKLFTQTVSDPPPPPGSEPTSIRCTLAQLHYSTPPAVKALLQ